MPRKGISVFCLSSVCDIFFVCLFWEVASYTSNVPLYPNPEQALARLIAPEVLSEQSLPTTQADERRSSRCKLDYL